METVRGVADARVAPLVAGLLAGVLVVLTTRLSSAWAVLAMAVVFGWLVWRATLMLRHRRSPVSSSGWELLYAVTFSTVAVVDGIAGLAGAHVADWSLGAWSLLPGLYVLGGAYCDWSALQEYTAEVEGE